MEEHVLQALSPRGAWQHVMARLSLRDELEEEVRVEVASLEGFEDEVIVDLVCRHCARAIQEQKFDVEELGWLLGLLLGGDRAASLVLCVVEFLDVGARHELVRRRPPKAIAWCPAVPPTVIGRHLYILHGMNATTHNTNPCAPPISLTRSAGRARATRRSPPPSW